jgi:hypothetical protein
MSDPTSNPHAELLAAARVALSEMCHTTAPRNSFTDAVDRLDAAISACSAHQTDAALVPVGGDSDKFVCPTCLGEGSVFAP